MFVLFSATVTFIVVFWMLFMEGSNRDGNSGCGSGCLGFVIVIILIFLLFGLEDVYTSINKFYNNLTVDRNVLTYILLPFIYQELFNLDRIIVFWTSVFINITSLMLLLKLYSFYLYSNNKSLFFIPVLLSALYLFAVFIKHAIGYPLGGDSILFALGWYAGNFLAFIGFIVNIEQTKHRN